MEEKTKIISFNKLEEDMIVAKNVEQNGRVLLRKDLAVTKQILKKSKNYILLQM